jgi:Flp pilus assembly pilin Flp
LTLPRENGATLVEYAMILFLVLIGAVTLVQSLGGSVLDMFTSVLSGF